MKKLLALVLSLVCLLYTSRFRGKERGRVAREQERETKEAGGAGAWRFQSRT